MKTIAMLNAKGGVGKTTSALCFADILARDYGKRVLVIDLDAQRNTGSQLGAGGCEIGVDTLLLDKDADIRELIRHTPFERIDVLPLHDPAGGSQPQGTAGHLLGAAVPAQAASPQGQRRL